MERSDIFRELEIRGELSIEELVKRQIERTNISASYSQEVFGVNVEILKSLLPNTKRIELEEKEENGIQQQKPQTI